MYTDASLRHKSVANRERWLPLGRDESCLRDGTGEGVTSRDPSFCAPRECFPICAHHRII